MIYSQYDQTLPESYAQSREDQTPCSRNEFIKSTGLYNHLKTRINTYGVRQRKNFDRWSPSEPGVGFFENTENLM